MPKQITFPPPLGNQVNKPPINRWSSQLDDEAYIKALERDILQVHTRVDTLFEGCGQKSDTAAAFAKVFMNLPCNSPTETKVYLFECLLDAMNTNVNVVRELHSSSTTRSTTSSSNIHQPEPPSGTPPPRRPVSLTPTTLRFLPQKPTQPPAVLLGKRRPQSGPPSLATQKKQPAALQFPSPPPTPSLEEQPSFVTFFQYLLEYPIVAADPMCLTLPELVKEKICEEQKKLEAEKRPLSVRVAKGESGKDSEHNCATPTSSPSSKKVVLVPPQQKGDKTLKTLQLHLKELEANIEKLNKSNTDLTTELEKWKTHKQQAEEIGYAGFDCEWILDTLGITVPEIASVSWADYSDMSGSRFSWSSPDGAMLSPSGGAWDVRRLSAIGRARSLSDAGGQSVDGKVVETFQIGGFKIGGDKNKGALSSSEKHSSIPAIDFDMATLTMPPKKKGMKAPSEAGTTRTSKSRLAQKEEVIQQLENENRDLEAEKTELQMLLGDQNSLFRELQKKIRHWQDDYTNKIEKAEQEKQTAQTYANDVKDEMQLMTLKHQRVVHDMMLATQDIKDENKQLREQEEERRIEIGKQQQVLGSLPTVMGSKDIHFVSLNQREGNYIRAIKLKENTTKELQSKTTQQQQKITELNTIICDLKAQLTVKQKLDQVNFNQVGTFQSLLEHKSTELTAAQQEITTLKNTITRMRNKLHESASDCKRADIEHTKNQCSHQQTMHQLQILKLSMSQEYQEMEQRLKEEMQMEKTHNDKLVQQYEQSIIEMADQLNHMKQQLLDQGWS